MFEFVSLKNRFSVVCLESKQFGILTITQITKSKYFSRFFGLLKFKMVAETPEEYLADLRNKFGWVEYLVFAIVLLMSAVIGIFHGFFSKRDQNNEEFLMGNFETKLSKYSFRI